MTSTETIYGRSSKFRLPYIDSEAGKVYQKRIIREAKGVKERLYF